MTIFLLSIDHRHGTNHYACSTYAIAESALDNYVQDNWADEMNGEPMPETAEARIAGYFDGNDEYFDIEELTIEGR